MNRMGMPGAFAIWMLLVLGVYLTGHPFFFNLEWLGKALLPPCPPWDAPFLPERLSGLLGSALIVAGFLAGAAAVGRQVSRWLRLKAQHPVGMLLGLGLLAIAWLGAGLAALWFPAIAWVAWITGAAAGGRHLIHLFRAFRSASGWWTLALLPLAWVTLAGALAPETELDPARYHLGLPERFIALHRVCMPERMMFASFPLNASMLFGTLELCGGQPAAKLFNWSLLWVIVALTFRLAGGGPAGAIAGVLLASIPMAWVHAAMGFAELTTTAFLTASLLLLLESRRITGALAGSAVFAGFALGTSYRAFHGVLPLALLWCVTTRRIATPVRFSAIAGAVALPWGIRNWLLAGNPVHPLAAWLGSFEDETAALSRSIFRLTDLVPEGTGPLTGLWAHLTAGDRSGSYPLGPVAAILLPIVVMAAIARRSVPAAFALLFAAAWTATTPGWSRYLLAALPAACAAAATVLGPWRDHRSRRPVMAGLVAAVTLAGVVLGAQTVFRRNHPVPHACGCETGTEYLAGRILPPPHGAAMLRIVERTVPAADRIYLWGMVTTAFSPRAGHADYEHSTPLFQSIVRESRDADDVARRFRQRRWTAFLHDLAGGVSQSASADLLPWTPRMTAVWQSFVRTRLVLTDAIERERDRAYLHLYRVRRVPDAGARLPRGTTWPHLPGMERLLVPGDARYDAGDLRSALRAYESTARDSPGYAWVWQRIGAVATELGDRPRARAAERRLKALGG